MSTWGVVMGCVRFCWFPQSARESTDGGKKGVTTQRVYKINNDAGWFWTLRRRWDGAYVKRDLFNVITYYVKSGTRIAEQARICVYNAHLFYFFKWPIISLDKTLIRRLVLFIALWICTETVILTFNRLESIGANYMDTNPGMFSSKTLIYFRLKKEIHKHIGWHGGKL